MGGEDGCVGKGGLGQEILPHKNKERVSKFALSLKKKNLFNV